MDEQLVAYETTRANVLARLEDLRAERRRMNWLGLGGLVATAIAACFGLTAMIVVAIMGASLFLTGHYVVFAHIHESKLTLVQLRYARGELGRDEFLQLSEDIRASRAAPPEPPPAPAEPSATET